MKKFLSLVASAVMMFSLVAMPVHAEQTAPTTVTDEETLRAAVKAGGEITLESDVTLTDEVVITSGLIIDGNDHTITFTSKKAFSIRNTEQATVSFKDVAITNTHTESNGSRCINTYNGNIVLNLENVILTTQGVGSMPINIGGSGKNIKVNITGSTINDSANEGYPITIYNPVNMTIIDSKITGLCCLNLKQPVDSLGSGDSVITVKQSELTATNLLSGETNSFTAIMIEDDNTSVMLDNTKIKAVGNESCYQSIVAFGNATTDEVKGSELKTSNGSKLTLIPQAYIATEKTDSGTHTKLTENTVSLALGTIVVNADANGNETPAEVDENYLPENTEVNENGEVVEIKPVLSIGSLENHANGECSVTYQIDNIVIDDKVRVVLYAGETELTYKKITSPSTGRLTCSFYTNSESSSWEEKAWTAYDCLVPTHAVLYVNGEEICTERVGFTEEQWISFTGTEEHSLVEVKEKKATCTVDGNKAYWTCEVCEEVYADETATTKTTIEEMTIKAGHKVVDVEAKEATCTEKGNTKGTKCSVCNKVLSGVEEIAASGHKEVLEGAKEATCKEEGHTGNKVCSECDEVLEEGKVIPKTTKHTYKDGKCTVCGADEPLNTQTGDNAPVMMFVAVAMLAMAAMVVLKKKELY